jgi:hypothetical protein
MLGKRLVVQNEWTDGTWWKVHEEMIHKGIMKVEALEEVMVFGRH